MMTLNRRELMPGVTLTAVQTEKFKTSLLGMTFLAPLSEQTAAEQALLPFVLRRGTKAHPDMEAMSAALDDLYGGSIEPMVRKKGDVQCVGFAGSFLDDAFVPEQSNVLESAAKLMAEVLLEPAGTEGRFQEDYLRSEKTNLADEIRSVVNDKRQYALHRLISQMFQGEAYGVGRYGEAEQVEVITGEALWNRYQTLLSEAPMLLYYCGSAPIERVEQALRAALVDLPQTNRSLAVQTQQQAPGEMVRYFEDRMDVTQGKLVMGFRFPEPCLTPGKLAPMLVLNALYGGSTTSKLFLHVRERLSLCYYASSMADKHKGVLFVNSGIAFEKYEEAKDEILAQLDDCRKGKIAGEELEGARRYIISSLRTTADEQGRLEDFWLGQFVAGMTNMPEDLAAAAEQVTLEEVQTLAAQLRLDSVYFLQGKEG